LPSIPSETVSAVAFSPSRSQTAGAQSPPSDNLPVVLEEAYAATVDPERYESLLDACSVEPLKYSTNWVANGRR